MYHDLSKLHPTQLKLYEEFLAEPRLPNVVPDALYEHYLDVSENFADLIGKDPAEMNKSQRARFKKKIADMKPTDVIVIDGVNRT